MYIYNFQVWISVRVWTKPARLSNLPRLIFISKGCGPKMTASENQCYISQIFRGCHFLLEMKFNRENLKAWLILSTLLRKSTPENYIQKAKCQFWLKNLFLCTYRISANSFRGNYSFLNLEIQRSQYVRPKVRKLFKGGTYSRAETI